MEDELERIAQETIEREMFLLLVAEGSPLDMAGHEVGWSPRERAQRLAEPDFAELVHDATTRMVDSVEKALIHAAVKGNVTAMQMVLLNLRPERWRDVKRIEVRTETTVNLGQVRSVKEAIRELMNEGGARALQPGGALDVIDAEVVDDASP